MLSNKSRARPSFARGRWAEIPARLQRARTNRNFVARLLLGCSPESNPTQLPTKAKTIEFRFIGMRAPPKSRAHAFPFSKKYRTQQVLHICYAIDMQQRLSLESELVLARKPVRDRSLSVSGAIAWSPGSTAISAGPERAAALRDARSA